MKYGLVYILLFCFLQSYTQSAFYLPVGFGLSHYQVKDEYNSALRYRGWVKNVHLGAERYGDFWTQNNFAYHFGGIKNGAKHPRVANLNRGSGTSTYLFNFSTNNEVDFFIGTTLKIQFSTRSSGKLFSFDGAGTLSVTLGATYNNPSREFDNRWFYDGNVSLPILGWGARPRFASLAYLGDVPPRKRPSQLFLLIPKHFDLDARFNANWNIGNGNVLRSSYRWWFYDSKYVHRVRAMENGFDLLLLTRLN